MSSQANFLGPSWRAGREGFGEVVIQLVIYSSRASFLAEHSGDWLLALPLASCGLHLDDEAVRVAVCLRL